MSTTSPCCWCDPLPCRQALDRSQSQSKLRCSPCIGKKTATDPGILPSFSSSEKPQKRRKRSHTNVSNTLVARLQHLRHKRRNARFKGLRRVHTPPHLLTAHTAAHRAKQGRFGWGRCHYHRTVLRGSETLRGRGSERLCRFWVLVGCAPEERREPAGQRHAHARRCSEASRPRWAA